MSDEGEFSAADFKRALDPKACPYWEDGEHLFTEDFLGTKLTEKKCRCGATVKPREGR